MNQKSSKIKEIRAHLKKAATIKELAPKFDQELELHLPVAVMPNESLVFRKYLVVKQTDKCWGLISIESKDVVDTFNLKSCALLAARARSVHNLSLVSDIKRLDNKYWSAYTDILVFENSIKSAKDIDHRAILENRLDYSKSQLELCRYKIQKAFKNFFA